MSATQRLKKLFDSGRSAFSMQDLRILWGESQHTARISAMRMADDGLIHRISRGYYALREDYDEYELANRIVSPSYVSFQSALFYAGMSFQDRGGVESAAKLNYRKKIGIRTYSYFALKDSLLFNASGVQTLNNVTIALPERAILDCLYLGFLPDIDRPEKINKSYLKKLAVFYPKTVQKKAGSIL